MGWAYRLAGPGQVERVEAAAGQRELQPGEIRLKFRAGGLCGSDLPVLRGHPGKYRGSYHGGAPLHELAGEVTESASEKFQEGDRVIGTGAKEAGLAEDFVEADNRFIHVPEGMTYSEAIPIQSIGTVLRVIDDFPDFEGARVAVIGAGPIGVAFVHALRHRGAGHITVIDPVDHREAALAYGVDDYVQLHSRIWAAQLDEADRPSLIVEAVGHQVSTIPDAIRAAATGAYIFGFGMPDEDDFIIPYLEMYQRGLTLASGNTLGGWEEVLAEGRDYVLEHRDDFRGYVTHTVPVDRAQEAYSLFLNPRADRLKVTMTND